jgi:hypothetical protein
MANVLADSFKRALLGGTGGPIDFDTDTLKIMLMNTTEDGLSDATRRAKDFRDDVTANEITGTNYTAGGATLASPTIASDGTNGYKVTFTNPTWATATFTAYGAWVYKALGGASSADPLIGYWTFGGAVTATAGTFTVTIPAGGLVVIP